MAVKSKKNSFECVSRNIKYDNNYLRAIIIYKSPKENNVRLTVDVANCYHTCNIEVYNTGNLKWNGLFTYQEVPNYEKFQYHIDGIKKIKAFQSNEELILKHLEKIYGNLI